MKFLKNIAAAALITTALSATAAMSAIDFDVTRADFGQTIAKLGITGNLSASPELELTEALIKARADMKVVSAKVDTDADAKKYLDAVHAAIEAAVKKAGGEQKLIDVLPGLGGKKLALDKPKATLAEEVIARKVMAAFVPVGNLLFKPSVIGTDLAKRAAVYKDVQFIDKADGNKAYTVAEIVARYAGHKKTDEQVADDVWVKTLVTAEGEKFEDVIAERESIDAAHAESFHDKILTKHATALAAKKATPTQIKGEALLGLLEKAKGKLGISVDLAAVDAPAIYKVIYDLIANADRLEDELAEMTKERDELRAAGGKSGGIGNLGGGHGGGGKAGSKTKISRADAVHAAQQAGDDHTDDAVLAQHAKALGGTLED